jgi:hypothetical protein
MSDRHHRTEKKRFPFNSGTLADRALAIADTEQDRGVRWGKVCCLIDEAVNAAYHAGLEKGIGLAIDDEK